jgi:dipeptidyl aminopeptidase/acylaminoacyl peptidase
MNGKMVVRRAQGIVVAFVVAAASTACQSQFTESPSPSSPSREPSSVATETASMIAELPDGSGRIVFGRFDPSFDDFVSYSIDPNGNGEIELLPGPHQLSRWSPDGGLIAITVVAGSRVFAATIRPGGSGYTELPVADPTLNLGCMLWSPDGMRLVCEAWDETDATRNGIYTINASDGSDLRRITSSPDGNHDLPGDYAPDGRLLFARIAPDRENGQLMVVDPAGGEPQQLTPVTYGIPRLSPDGQTILAEHDGVLHLIPLDGGPTATVHVDGVAFGGSWSPDGAWIVFSLAPPGGKADVYRARPDGSELFQITSDPAQEEFADWAP